MQWVQLLSSSNEIIIKSQDLYDVVGLPKTAYQQGETDPQLTFERHSFIFATNVCVPVSVNYPWDVGIHKTALL